MIYLLKNIKTFVSARYASLLLRRVKKKDRYKRGNIVINNTKIEFIDSISFYYQYKEIFNKEIYHFKSSCNSPYIIDCGSNIGLSILFFKKKYPESRVIGFEPDPSIFSVLKNNISRNNCDNIQLINKAIWISETNLAFTPDGSDGGRISLNKKTIETVSVPSVCLSDFLNEDVDFLKIDIEGAETIVLQSCKEKLNNIKNIFIEYHSIAAEKQELHNLLKILSDAGFRVDIHSISKNKKPFIKSKENSFFDMQLNIFAYKS